ncbi:hypothetical protein [Oceaniferula spumae]|uniref:hypothetical protein n=1 Tax=Oceaniferula spumae TaxID=2979115 RepID=UPI003F4F3170
MSLPQAHSTPPSSDKKLLRFGCPACGVRLVVDQAIAGTEGPCPSCGARIIAPPLEAARDLVNKQAAPLAVKPRQAGGLATSDMTNRNADAASSSTSAPTESGYTPSRRRSVSPSTVISEKHREQSNTVIFFKIIAAVLVVLLIVAAVYLTLKQGS